MPPLRIHRLVAAELNEAHAWYASRSPVAADNFSVRFADAMEGVKARPGSHAPWRAIFRRARLVPFPYLLLFHLDHAHVSVLLLVHARRDPDQVLSTIRVRLEKFS